MDYSIFGISYGDEEMRWEGSRVTLTYAEELGVWVVNGVDDGWLRLFPLEQAGTDLARLGTDGRLWVNRKDVTRQPDQKETLF